MWRDACEQAEGRRDVTHAGLMIASKNGLCWESVRLTLDSGLTSRTRAVCSNSREDSCERHGHSCDT